MGGEYNDGLVDDIAGNIDFYLQERKKDSIASRFIYEKHLENIPQFYT